MPDSPASPTPYEVLGVAATASHAELRRAYRRLLRETHPDTGGNPARFHAVQKAWQRIGEPTARVTWDKRHSTSFRPMDPTVPTGPPPAKRQRPEGSALRARSYGHPGGQARERFLALMREWAGRGPALGDPYDVALVRSAPGEIRHLMAKALAEEATARAVSTLGIGYTIWNDVDAGGGKIDHVVLGPAGLFAITSEDWGSEVRLVRGELDGGALPPGSQPIRTLTRRSRALGRQLGVRFTAALIVVPDDALQDPVTAIGRKGDVAVARLSLLPLILRDGVGRGERLSIEDVFDVRTRLQHGIRFV